jgi:hypothetical protein
VAAVLVVVVGAGHDRVVGMDDQRTRTRRHVEVGSGATRRRRRRTVLERHRPTARREQTGGCALIRSEPVTGHGLPRLLQARATERGAIIAVGARNLRVVEFS